MQKCPSCPRVDAEMGTCGSMVTCPIMNGQASVEVNPDRDIVLHCDPCNLLRVLPATKLTRRVADFHMDFTCPRGEEACECRVIRLPSVTHQEPQPTHVSPSGRTQRPAPK